MQESKRYLRLGLFVFATLLLTAAVLFVMGGRSLFEPTYTFETYFNQSVDGLDIGSPVKFRGVPLGTVTDILTSAAAYESYLPLDRRRDYIVVRAKVVGSKAQVAEWKTEAQAMAERGMRAQTQLAGITGQQFLSLDWLDPRKYPRLPFDWAPEYPYLPSAPSLAGEIIANAQQFLAHLNQTNIKELVDNVNKLAVNLNKKLDELSVAELDAKASALLTDSRETVKELKRLLAQPHIGETLANLAAISGRLRQFVDSGEIDQMGKTFDDLAQRLDAVVGDNQYDLRAIVQDLRSTADNMRTLSETLKRYPAGALIGGPPKKLHFPGESK
jgi:phospholipid/cholesterol/gamma-HCH transport system substrate-binding protein/paraquat-inducible protein B